MVSAHNLDRNYVGFEIGKIDPETGMEIYSSAILEMINRRIASKDREKQLLSLLDFLKKR